ncbi:MAG: response regulator [Chloroflexota bacterium]|nr:response regulator [Chloroflexota bacterium]
MAKILIVEDNDTILNLLKTLLELEGYQVFLAVEEKAIIQSLSQVSPDLVLLDIHLRTDNGTEVSGYEILEYIRRTPEFKNIRVLMTSGIDLREQALKAGADGFILKPYIPDELVNSIRVHIKQVT